MISAFIFHGSNGNPNKHWYPWLKEKLEQKGLKVFAPQLPIGKEQTLNNWLNSLKPMKDYIKNSIMIGHSLGVPFILNILNQWDYKVSAAFFVSGFVGYLEIEDEPGIEDFSEREFDWNKIKTQCDKFYVIHADNDPYVPLRKAKELARKLGVKIILVKGGGHFQTESEYKTFNLLFEKIKENLV